MGTLLVEVRHTGTVPARLRPPATLLVEVRHTGIVPSWFGVTVVGATGPLPVGRVVAGAASGGFRHAVDSARRQLSSAVPRIVGRAVDVVMATRGLSPHSGTAGIPTPGGAFVHDQARRQQQPGDDAAHR